MAQVADVREGMVVTLDGRRVVTSSAEIRTAFSSSCMQHNAGKSLQTPANDLKRADKNLQNRRALVIGWLTSP
jgi:hypothetical protein